MERLFFLILGWFFARYVLSPGAIPDPISFMVIIVSAVMIIMLFLNRVLTIRPLVPSLRILGSSTWMITTLFIYFRHSSINWVGEACTAFVLFVSIILFLASTEIKLTFIPADPRIPSIGFTLTFLILYYVFFIDYMKLPENIYFGGMLVMILVLPSLVILAAMSFAEILRNNIPKVINHYGNNFRT